MVSCEVKLFVAGIAFSRPAQVCRLALASREMVESATLEMATVFAPRLSASRGAVAIFAGVFHVHSNACQIFHHDFAGEAGVAAGAAGGDDDFFEGEECFFDGLERVRKNCVVRDILADGFANGLRLLVDFAQHVIWKLRWGNSQWPVLLGGHQCPAPVDDAGTPRASLRGMLAGAMFHPETVSSEPLNTEVDGR